MREIDEKGTVTHALPMKSSAQLPGNRDGDLRVDWPRAGVIAPE
jgi:hypothetical protein